MKTVIKTPARVITEGTTLALVDDHARTLARFTHPVEGTAEMLAHLAACVNACAGIPTEALQDNDRNLLRQAAAALEGAAAWLDNIDLLCVSPVQNAEFSVGPAAYAMPNNTQGRAAMRSLARKLRGDYDATA